MANIIHVAKYLLTLADSSSTKVNPLKLQKLLYYCEGWTLAITDKELFPGENFQAWLHGPVNVTVYHEFNTSYGMFDPIDTPKSVPPTLTVEQRAILERVFEVYNQYSGSELETMTHREKPWMEARGSLGPNMHSDRVIDKDTMRIEFSDFSQML